MRALRGMMVFPLAAATIRVSLASLFLDSIGRPKAHVIGFALRCSAWIVTNIGAICKISLARCTVRVCRH